MQVTQEKRLEQKAVTSPATPARVEWADALMRQGHATLFQSMAAELSQYLNLPIETVTCACDFGEKYVAEDWSARNLHKGSDPSRILEYYRTTESYFFDLTKFNSEYPHIATLNALVNAAHNRGLVRVLDFGSGIGSVGIFFARNGFDVSLADVSEPLRHYARWRLAIRGINGRLIDLNCEQLPDAAFDIVTAFDVLEHLPRPAEAIYALARSMKIGGLIALNVEEPAARFPQHISTYESVLATVAAAGFRRVKYIGKTEIFERVERGKLSTCSQALWGKIWFGALYRPCINLLDLLGIKNLLRVLIKGPRK